MPERVFRFCLLLLMPCVGGCVVVPPPQAGYEPDVLTQVVAATREAMRGVDYGAAESYEFEQEWRDQPVNPPVMATEHQEQVPTKPAPEMEAVDTPPPDIDHVSPPPGLEPGHAAVDPSVSDAVTACGVESAPGPIGGPPGRFFPVPTRPAFAPRDWTWLP